MKTIAVLSFVAFLSACSQETTVKSVDYDSIKTKKTVVDSVVKDTAKIPVVTDTTKTKTIKK
jgi:ABC-type uncharacterized transport system auxiliary subunit